MARESWEERQGSRTGPGCLGASFTLHSWPSSTRCSRNRDYDDIDDDDPFNPQAWRMAAHNPPRGQLHSFCSYSSGLGSQTSLQPPAQTISNAPVSEYMYGLHTHPGWVALPGQHVGWGPQCRVVGGRHPRPPVVPTTATGCLEGRPPGSI